MTETISKILLGSEVIQQICVDLGNKITHDYNADDKNLLIVCVLKGATIFFSDLLRRIECTNCEIDFLEASSYEGTESTGHVRITKGLDHSDNLAKYDILLVEDILDTGRTLKSVKESLLNQGAKSVKICTLLDKPDRRAVDIEADYVGRKIENEFVIGYGLDYNERYRNLPYIGVLELSKE